MQKTVDEKIWFAGSQSVADAIRPTEVPDLFHLLRRSFGSSDGQILLKRGIEDHHILHGGTLGKTLW